MSRCNSSCSPRNARYRLYYLFRSEPIMKRSAPTQNERFLDAQLLERHRKEVRKEQIRFMGTIMIALFTVTLLLVILWFALFTFIDDCDDTIRIPVLTKNLNYSTFSYVADVTLPKRILSHSLNAIFYRWKCPHYPTYYVEI